MLTFMKKDGSIILPHLDYILKSYYFSTEINVFAIDDKSNKILAYENNYIEDKIYNINLQKINDYIINTLKSKNINDKDTLLYTHMKKFTYLIAPYFHNAVYRGALISGPILLNKKSSTDIDEILEYEHLPITCRPKISKLLSKTPVKLIPRNFFLAQLLHHLMSTGIDVGMQHIEELEMRKTFIGKSFDIEELKITPNSCNIAIIKQLTENVLLGNINNALLIYKKGFIIKNYDYMKNLDQLKLIKYDLISLCINLINSSIIFIKILEKDTIQIKNKHIFNIDSQKNIQDVLLSGELMIKDITSFINKYTLKNKSKYVQKAVSYINNNYNKTLTLEKVSNYVHINQSYFSTIFKTEMNESFKNYLNKLRIEHSKAILLTTNNSISDVALTVGFDNQNYFSTVFKKHTKMSPKEYISSHTIYL